MENILIQSIHSQGIRAILFVALYNYFWNLQQNLRLLTSEVVRTVQEMAGTFTEDFLGSLRERNIDLESKNILLYKAQKEVNSTFSLYACMILIRNWLI